MKNIDIKSLIIGALLTSTIFLGVAATSPTDKWDEKQEWVEATWTKMNAAKLITSFTIGESFDGKPVKGYKIAAGWEPVGNSDYRKRIK
jgi:uncharacterized protein YbdZ (MbtH family)